MYSMNKFVAAAAVAGMVVIASPAQATVTFAQFLQAIPNAPIFNYSNVNSGGFKAKLGTAPGSNTVLVSELGSLASPSLALVSLVGNSTALPTVGANIQQLFSGSLTFTLLAPQFGMSGWSTNALTVTFTDAVFYASAGGHAPTLDANSGSGSTITYMSDFADLSGATDQDFSLSFSGASSPLSIAASRLPDFHVSGSGTFAAAFVPEPGSWSMMLGGFSLMGLLMRSRRKAAAIFN
jgi:hypothetical protein